MANLVGKLRKKAIANPDVKINIWRQGVWKLITYGRTIPPAIPSEQVI